VSMTEFNYDDASQLIAHSDRRMRRAGLATCPDIPSSDPDRPATRVANRL